MTLYLELRKSRNKLESIEDHSLWSVICYWRRELINNKAKIKKKGRNKKEAR